MDIEINIPHFTDEQKKDNLKLAVAALKKNPRKATRVMKDEKGGRCCLCVISEVAEDICGVERGDFQTSHMPRFNLSEVFAIPTEHNDETTFYLHGVPAQQHNDGGVYNNRDIGKKSHKMIAKMIEEKYLNS